MKQKLTIPNLISINIYWFGLSFLWNTLHPIVLPAILLNFVPDANKNTYLGLLTFLGLILAMVVQPISGAASDRSTSRWGKRRPFIALGTLLDLVVLLFIAFTNTLTGIFLGYIILQIASNIAQGPMQGLIPDLVPEKQKGLASGIKNFMDVFGLIAASLLAGILLVPGEPRPIRVFLAVMGILCISAIITIITTRENTNEKQIPTKLETFSLRNIFSLDIKSNRAFFNLIISRFIFLLGVYGIQTFAQYYIRDVLAVDNAVKATGMLMIVIAISLIICVLISGFLSDRTGPGKLMNAAMLITAVGGFSLIFVQDMKMLMVVAGFIGAGMGLYLTSNWTMAVKVAPADQAGRFLGLTNLATAGASALGRLEGPLIDFANQLKPGFFLGYKAMFFFCFLCSILSLMIFQILKKRTEKRVNPNNVRKS
jgi:Na+/melibiose symporter-like transporter